MDEKRGIGKDNKIPWHISEDFKRFKKITSGHPIIMGRKTWDSLPFKPLPNRTNIIVTHDLNFSPHQIHHKLRNCSICESLGYAVVNSLEQAIDVAKKKERDNNGEIFIIGGGQIFQQALPFADRLYLTIVEGEFDADTFFPDYSSFKKVVFEESHASGGYKYKFLELER